MKYSCINQPFCLVFVSLWDLSVDRRRWDIFNLLCGMWRDGVGWDGLLKGISPALLSVILFKVTQVKRNQRVNWSFIKTGQRHGNRFESFGGKKLNLTKLSITQMITLIFNILHALNSSHETTKINNVFVCLSIPCCFFPSTRFPSEDT